jgi:hypothetical protein
VWSVTSAPPRNRRAVHDVVGVGVGDRLALDADLLALHRDRLRHVLGNDVLARAGAAGLALRGADAQLLLGARHRAVGLRAADVVADTSGGPCGGGSPERSDWSRRVSSRWPSATPECERAPV